MQQACTAMQQAWAAMQQAWSAMHQACYYAAGMYIYAAFMHTAHSAQLCSSHRQLRASRGNMSSSLVQLCHSNAHYSAAIHNKVPTIIQPCSSHVQLAAAMYSNMQQPTIAITRHALLDRRQAQTCSSYSFVAAMHRYPAVMHTRAAAILGNAAATAL